ncbi:hypothetical protein N7471_010628 [Penicillium samsonianum]|uniref:uncharacterized protein n=1 Tax=Penicillium samsonianum TaxID=1882272 RepID=UPI0025489B20|nr:uncharacterized protein N7471_010628 [Penicillium samsonianum]KAJ6126135.1 hypothetical protein N7471_010628 [Penicillium samsonianum]
MALGIALRPQSRTAAEARIDLGHLDKKLRQWCGLFIFTKNSKIYLIHQTAREFLVKREAAGQPYSTYSCTIEDTEDQMAGICLRYLSMDGLDENDAQTCSDFQSFLAYSAVYWPDHVRNMSSTAERLLKNLLHRLYDTTANRFSLWFPIYWKAVMGYTLTPTMNAIHLAAFNGHEHVVRHLLAGDERIAKTADSTRSYPLIWASLNGHQGVVHALLERGADVNAQAGEYGSALQAACSRGHGKIVQVLLERGAGVDAQDGEYGSALYAACSGGHDTIVQVLLERGGDVNAQSGSYGNALQVACSGGYDKVVHVLLKRGANINSQDGEYGSALYTACFKGHDNIVQVLLERGADINALQAACSGGHDKVVQVLLKRGANVNAQDREYGNALQVACARGHETIVQELLECGANVNAQGKHCGNDPLQASSSEGHDKIVQLLKRGADVSGRGGEYGNALQAFTFQNILSRWSSKTRLRPFNPARVLRDIQKPSAEPRQLQTMTLLTRAYNYRKVA